MIKLFKNCLTKIQTCFVSIIAAFLIQIGHAHAIEPVLLVGSSLIRGPYDYLDQSIFELRWVGGWGLNNHFNDALSRSIICNGHTFVVLQDFTNAANNPSLFENNLENMIPFVRSCDAVPVLFMNWENNFINYGTLRNAYQDAAAEHDVQLIAVGTVWNRIRNASESLYQSLLHPDGKHATFRGDRVNAASLYKAFCESCYQSFNWNGFSGSEISFIKSVIDQYIDKVVEPAPEEFNFGEILPQIYLLLLNEDAP